MNKVKVTDRMYFYANFAEEFDSKMNIYDTKKRVKVFYEELMIEDIEGKKLLDAGCGTGWFSKEASKRKAKVYSMDIGEKLLEKVKEKCPVNTVVGSILEIPFSDNTFDFVVSSEVIEHTPDPILAITELYRVLKPGGIMVLSTPNKLWYFSVWIANLLNLRPYHGLENWTSWRKMRKELRKTGFIVNQMVGIHLFPFVCPVTYPVLDFFHKYNKGLGPLMVNIAVKCTKPA